MQYVVLQVILKEKLWGTGSGNLISLEKAINDQAAKGYRLHTITTASSGSKGSGAATASRQRWCSRASKIATSRNELWRLDSPARSDELGCQ